MRLFLIAPWSPLKIKLWCQPVYMSWSKAVGILIISRILSPARPLGLKQNVYCVKNMSGWHSAVVSLIIWQPSLLKFPKMECSCQNDALHCTCIYGSLYRCGEMVAHLYRCGEMVAHLYRCGEMVAHLYRCGEMVAHLYRCGEMVAHAFSLNTGWTLGCRAEDP